MPKAQRSAKQKAADLKKLQDWEAKQAEENRISNDKEVFKSGVEVGKSYSGHAKFVAGLVFGASTVLVAGAVVIGLLSFFEV